MNHSPISRIRVLVQVLTSSFFSFLQSLLNVVSVSIQPTSKAYPSMATPTFHNMLFLPGAHHHQDLPPIQTSANFPHHEGGDRYGMDSFPP